MLNIKENQRESNSLTANKRMLQVERGEIFYREDIKYTFAYAMFGIMVILAVGGISYSFIEKLKK
jgi:hypothetical protein